MPIHTITAFKNGAILYKSIYYLLFIKIDDQIHDDFIFSIDSL